MLLLVTDTSGKHGFVGLVRAGAPPDKVEVIEEVPLAGGTFSAQLVPQISALLAKHGFSKGDIDAFVVVSGPGSFTGLRVGLAAIKALAEILRKPIVPVSLLEVVAVASRASGKLLAVLDAGRGELYAAEYQVAGEAAQLLQERLLAKDEFLAMAKGLVVATPDEALAGVVRDGGIQVPLPSARMIARLGWHKLQAGEVVAPERLEANYIRRSDAEMFSKRSGN
ncbi:MAG: tRNA (adenosine(37)-N6)-threonylcarbamoyltransferase complex dimerization subunit type 1 TsaB [Candidatus Sulfotelmatobacter sp.]|jgi:tRNA threonylcarbamoyladenosine biosynthesis protein TsaB